MTFKRFDSVLCSSTPNLALKERGAKGFHFLAKQCLFKLTRQTLGTSTAFFKNRIRINQKMNRTKFAQLFTPKLGHFCVFVIKIYAKITELIDAKVLSKEASYRAKQSFRRYYLQKSVYFAS